ncbi:MAG: VOC family protein [Candidatus Neomarinimicrobiota bacterium]|tara:strand:- start:376 stop:792 length:417 start_codon:yes stop_codon:yes gene_type:complete
MNTRFHLAFPVKDLEQTKIFYLNILGCSLGRESLKWVDFNLFGHQIVAHLSPEDCGSINRNQVDGDKIPARHFGVILNWDIWENLIKSIKEKDIVFYIKPKIRFKNKKGEQGTFFVLDPSENVLEFKSFKNDSMVFER